MINLNEEESRYEDRIQSERSEMQGITFGLTHRVYRWISFVGILSKMLTTFL